MGTGQTENIPAAAQDAGGNTSDESVTSPHQPLHSVLRELACAEAMIGLAEFSLDFEGYRRSYKNALQAYNLALSFLPHLQVGFEEQQEIARRLGHIHKWLQLVGLTLISD
jgi:hypothetical protein